MYHLLVCDDEWIIRSTLAQIAGENGNVRVSSASGGREALELICADPPDGMIVDVCMPGMDGLELLRVCREELRCEIPAVVLSGYDKFEYAQRAIHYGVLQYALKPILPEEIRQIVRLLLERAAERSAAAAPMARPAPGRPEADAEAAPDETRGRKIVSDAMALIERRYMQDIGVGELADAAGMSKNYFGQLFKSVTCTAVSEYINTVRMEHAKLLLRTTNLKVYEIACRVGFEDPFYFSSIFKKIVGMPPKEYRER